MTLVSVIIPSFNYGFVIEETLNSLLNQSYSNWEAIIVDDGSTDNSREIIKKYAASDKRFKYIFQDNKGVSTARNVGIKEAQGSFIQFLDADDLISADKLAIQLSFFDKHPEVDICYTDHVYFEDGKPEIFYPDYEMEFKDWMPRLCDKGFNILDSLLYSNIAVMSSPLVRKKIVELTGGFPEFSNHTEDWEFWFRCAVNGAHFCYLKHADAKTIIRIHRHSVSKDLRIMREGEIRFRDRISDYICKSLYLSTDEKQKLLAKNRDRKRKLYKLMMYDISLINVRDLRRMARVSDSKIFFSFYFKALNYKRKALFKNDKSSFN